MSNSGTPKDGDFVAYLKQREEQTKRTAAIDQASLEPPRPEEPESGTRRPQTLADILLH